MAKIIESVPNISEARREDVLRRILDSIKGVPDTRVLDVKPDQDHNRTVISLAGSPAGLIELLLKLYESCVKEIDPCSAASLTSPVWVSDICFYRSV